MKFACSRFSRKVVVQKIPSHAIYERRIRMGDQKRVKINVVDFLATSLRNKVTHFFRFLRRSFFLVLPPNKIVPAVFSSTKNGAGPIKSLQ